MYSVQAYLLILTYISAVV